MVLALGQNDCYNRYISAFLEQLLHVTAELIEMVQYIFKRIGPDEGIRGIYSKNENFDSMLLA